MILSQAIIIVANLCSLSIAEVYNINSLDPTTMVWVYEFLSLTVIVSPSRFFLPEQM
jgi:hypothetical protein